MCRSAFLCTVAAVVMQSGAAFAESDQQAANKQTVVAFYEAAINQKDFATASQYIGSRYTQHNPNAADGPEGFKRFIEFLREKFPSAHSEIKKVFTDDDYVILHVHAVREAGTRGNAIVDIFKLENGKIVEHWDVVQPIPEQASNSNGMF
jgi:predicted SnoaL-like aldol condensation-catalyzing enzyme